MGDDLVAEGACLMPAAQTDRVLTCYLHPGQVSGHFCQSLANLLMYDGAHHRRVVASLACQAGPNLSRPRNEGVRKFLSTNVEWLALLDSDMVFPPNALDRLLAQADATRRPIVSGLYFQSLGTGIVPVLFAAPRGQGPLDRLLDYPDDTLLSVAATGAAFMLVHRQVLEKIESRRFSVAYPWFQETEVDGRQVGEDITFCRRAADVGASIHVDTGLHIGHHKSRVLDHDMFRAQQQSWVDSRRADSEQRR